MNKNEIIRVNKNSWDIITKNKIKVLNTSLPKYGPYSKNEEELNIMNIKGSKIIKIGCGVGIGVQYLVDKGANKVVGIDISEERINIPKKKNIPNAKFICKPMEEEIVDYENYFDYAVLVYCIGYSSDIDKTFKNIYKYLKVGGKLIISWTHPFFECISIHDNQLIVESRYENTHKNIVKGDKLNLVVSVNKMSYIINDLIENNFRIFKVIEERSDLDLVSNGLSNFYSKDKIESIPGTIIYVASKE